ncbi:MAG: hypothetical protein L6408_07230, partial [Nanoarchaeota archaeon]|nr:hypothetical protein [Nanoarchaeota archaeon]
MLDIKFIRENPQLLQEALKKRGAKISLDKLLSSDEKRRTLL